MPNVGDGTGMSGGGETKDGLTWRPDTAMNPGKPYDAVSTEGVKKDPGGNRAAPIRSGK